MIAIDSRIQMNTVERSVPKPMNSRIQSSIAESTPEPIPAHGFPNARVTVLMSNTRNRIHCVGDPRPCSPLESISKKDGNHCDGGMIPILERLRFPTVTFTGSLVSP